jgi:PPOX class probable FMN-dependent enzyme
MPDHPAHVPEQIQHASGARFADLIESEDALRTIIGRPSQMLIDKQLDHLDAHARHFIARSPFLVIGSAGADFVGDASPRGDAPGFVKVLDDRTLAIPDRPGNRRADTLLNILASKGIGLLFIIPGIEETLRVNGRACLARDSAILDTMVVQGKPPLLVIGVTVTECYFQCAKAFKRSKLWQPEGWPGRDGVASLAQILVDQTKPAGTSVEELDAMIAESYVKRLY